MVGKNPSEHAGGGKENWVREKLLLQLQSAAKAFIHSLLLESVFIV